MNKKILFPLFIFLGLFTYLSFSETVRVITEKADIKLNPEVSSLAIAVVTLGTVLESISKEESWFKVKFKDLQGFDKIGYIHESQVELMRDRKELREEAMKKEMEEKKKPTIPETKESSLKKEELEKETKTTPKPASKTPALLSSVSVRILGGYAPQSSGDINDDILSRDQIFRDQANYYQKSHSLGYVSGGHNSSAQGFGGGADVFLDLTKKLSIGAGLEIYSKANQSNQTVGEKWNEKSFHEINRNISDKIGMTAILLKGKYHFPIAKRMTLFVEMEAGIYLVKVNYDITWNGNYEYWANGTFTDSAGILQKGWFRYIDGSWNQKDTFQITKSKLGFSGGLGGEFTITKKLSLVFKVKERFLSFNQLTAKESFIFSEEWKEAGQDTSGFADLRNWNDKSKKDQWDSEDILYLYDYSSKDLSSTYSFLTSNRNGLQKESENSNFRPAKINFGAYGIFIGVRVKL